ncbi:hypothetical protein [Roseobacter sp. HKCCA0434]|uniref:hypothetical protein n=1 Tax=Roseobacter sp. HKCCA0434 TaxID=3079297 RepID=UPI0029059428|nr:hypothetical protein [Roseobacter sp. HKCCA0434]
MADPHEHDDSSSEMRPTGRDSTGRWMAVLAAGGASLLAIIIIFMVLFEDEESISVDSDVGEIEANETTD